MLLFKEPHLKGEFEQLPLELQTIFHRLDRYCFDSGMERPTISDIKRTRDDQERIWTPVYVEQGHPEAEARKLARDKFSWHLIAALDFRHTVKPYSKEERARIWEWLKANCPEKLYELLEHNIGLGLHFHIGRRLWGEKARYEQGLKGP